MTLMRWSPVRSMIDLQNEVNQLFNDFYSSPGTARSGATVWHPLVDISETENEIIVVAEVPGMNKEDLKISIQENILTLQGEKKQEQKKKDEQYHRIEREYGQFERSFSLPTTVNTNKIKATCKEGVLTIILPKTEEAKPKELAIQVE